LPSALSAGGVVYRRTPTGPEIVICGRESDGIWRLPKGTPEPGELLEHTALREVQEETGLTSTIEQRIGDVRYQFTAPDGVRYDKRVEHFLMKPTGGSLSNHDGEFDIVRWAGLGEALRLLRFPNERRIVREAARLIREQEHE
jgi:8-oxo-dGTP pyrophosphatase MutT (NUDIX family)